LISTLLRRALSAMPTRSCERHPLCGKRPMTKLALTTH
jgi:hypothetical protein